MSSFSPFDFEMLQQALQLSLEGRVTAPPNPWVGCILVNGDVVVGKGFSQPAGGLHAEAVALQGAGDRARGAVAYVTLEPCCHFGKTPPCTQALIKAGVKRVVVGMQDPDRRVQGQGIAELRRAGIEVAIAEDSSPFAQVLASYIHHRTTGLPYCIGKSAVSIDGRTAAEDGSSQWISSEEARYNAHQLRAESQAILIGIGTALKDFPQLTVRNVSPKPVHPPLRVILDSLGRLPVDHPLLDTEKVSTLIATTEACSKHTIEQWKSRGAEVFIAPTHQQRVDISPVLKHLGEKGILQLLIEGGASVLGSFLEEKRLQKICLYVGPCILGNSGLPLFYTHDIHSLLEAPKLSLAKVTPLGNTIRLDYNI